MKTTQPAAAFRARLAWLAPALLAALFAANAVPVRASGCFGEGDGSFFYLVKESVQEQVFVATANCDVDVNSDITAFNWVLEGFSAAPAVTPAGAEPAHTVELITETGFSLSNGASVANYQVFPKSLNDLGVYHYRWTGTACSPDGQGGTACGPMLEDTLSFPVGNSPPTASIAIGGEKHVGHTLSFDANGGDADHGGAGLHFTWSVVSKPSSAVAAFSSASASEPTMALTDKHDIGDWTIRLKLDDQEGERKQFDKSFTVENQEPTITIDGPDDIDALDDIALQAGPDTDDDGEDVTFSWDILIAPPGASQAPQSNFDTSDSIVIPTGAPDIGIWRFRCTATDEHGASASAEHEIEVHAIPPEIALEGATEIDVGDTLHQATTILEDAYGEPLTFDWALIQAPLGAGKSVPSSASASAAVDLPTGASGAGTWGLRLTVTDHIGETATEAVYVLVDAEPEAAIEAPAISGNLTADLTLDGSGSIDPDSPDAPPDFGHETSEPPVQVSPGLVEYTWRVLQVPPAVFGDYFPGSVADVFGIDGSGPMLDLPAGTLPSGSWTFELEVVDGEGNTAFANHAVDVIDEGMPPIATILGPAYFLTDVSGFTPQDIVADGRPSFDIDNLLDEPLAPGLGIVDYAWSHVAAPFGCSTPPALPSGPAASTATLFGAGDAVPPPCQGAYQIGLTVTDDDTPDPKTGFASQMLFIGNCPQDICIDYPLQQQPQYIKFSDQTDVIVYYHLNSVLYDLPVFVLGMQLQLRIFHESDLLTPAFDQAFDLDMLPTDKGGFLAVHWSGFDNLNQRPLSGKYSIELELLDAGGAPTGSTAREEEAIHIQTLDVAAEAGTTRYARRRELQDGSAEIQIEYDVTGASPGDPTPFDELQWRVFEAGGNTLVYSESVPGPLGAHGFLPWDGDRGAGNFIATGDYEIELTLLDQGAVLGTSARVPLTVFDFGFVVAGNPGPDSPPGVRVFANVDDDDRDAVADNLGVAAGEDDLVQIDLQLSGLSAGTANLSSNAPAGALRLWTTANKAAEIALPAAFDLSATPLPAIAFVEGVAMSQPRLTLTLNMPGGEVLGPFDLALTIAELRLLADSDNDHAITAADNPALAVRIGHWNNSYDAAGNPQNAAGNAHLAEQDAERFYLQLKDLSANADPAAVDTATVRIGTLDKANAVDDDLGDLVLTESGANTSEFVSRSQLLMSPDMATNADDDFSAHDGIAAAVADDAAGDRTHRAAIDGAVRFTYQPAGLAAAKPWTVPVCLRTPEERRKAEIRVVVFNEPFQDTGFDHDANPGTPPFGAGNNVFDFTDGNANGVHDAGEASESFIDFSAAAAVFGNTGSRAGVVTQADVDAQVARANLAWAQACVSFVNLGTTFVDAPKNGLGVDILADGKTDIGGADEAPVITAFAATAKVDEITVFYTAPNASWFGLSRTPSDVIAGMGELSFVYMSTAAPARRRTLAHEFGHVLTNDFDSAQPLWIYYPQNAAPLGSDDDGLVTQRRRLLDAAVIDARTVRAAGAVMAKGNRILKLP